MDLDDMISLLNADLKNEWKHLRFYLYSASAVIGPHREEYKEFFLKAAASEMTHITAFSDVIYGLGGEATKEANEFVGNGDLKLILQDALKMEEEVITNYVQRMKDAASLGGVDGQWLEIFLEGQIQDSREDADNIKRILRGM